jgi:hypothetical protein
MFTLPFTTNEMPPFLLLFFIAFGMAWLAVISFLTGWHAPAKCFRAQDEPYGDTRVVDPLFSTV